VRTADTALVKSISVGCFSISVCSVITLESAHAMNVLRALWLSAALIFCASCAAPKVAYAPDTPELMALKAKRFTLKVDCYVFRYIDERKGPPHIGPISNDPKLHVPGIPTTVDRSILGKRKDDYVFLGIVPKGTRFTVKALRYETTFEMGTIPMFEIALDGQGRDYWPVLNAAWLTDARSGTVRIEPDAAE
jgi:hypothetical protein